MAAKKGLDLIKCIVERSIQMKSYDALCLKPIKLVSAGDGNCTAEFTVGEDLLNSGGTLHGGCTATLVDCISTLALMTNPAGSPGVSVDLHVTNISGSMDRSDCGLILNERFLKAALPGEVVVIDAKTIKAGRTLAFLEVELKKKNDGIIVARGQHTKFIGS